MSAPVQTPEIEQWDEELVDDEAEDYITQWFRYSEPNAVLPLHERDCRGKSTNSKLCDCQPITLKRGAKA